MPSMLFLAAVVLGIVAALIFFIFSSDVLTKRAPKIATDFINNIADAVARATERCGGHQTKDECESDSICKWCEIVDENQNTVLFCTTQKRAADLKCS